MNIKEINEIVESICIFADFVEHIPQSRERNIALMKLQECVFWLTYLNQSEEVLENDTM